MDRSVSQEPHAKRKRTAQACAPCRTKKTKCDGIGPPCTPCSMLKSQCSYPLISTVSGGRNSVLVSKAYLDALEDRLKRLEAPERNPSSSSQPPGRGTHAQDKDHTSSIVGQYRQGVQEKETDEPTYHAFEMGGPTFSDSLPFDISPIASRRGDGNRFQTVSPIQPTQHEPVRARSRSNHFHLSPVDLSGRNIVSGADGMGVLPPLFDTPASHSEKISGRPISDFGHGNEVYGRTSGISFHKLLLDTLLPGYQCLAQEDPFFYPRDTEPSVWNPLTSDKSFDSPMSLQDLPDPQEAATLWSFYFSHTHAVYPFISESSTKAGYLDILSASPSDQAATRPQLAFQALLFSLALRVSGRTLPGKDVYRLAQTALSNHTSWPHTLRKVQVLLLGALLMQSFDSPSASWDLLGMAVRSAYAIGLHEADTSTSLSDLDNQLRIRAWWMCFTLDRLLTVTIGRPSAITARGDSPLPKALPDEPPTITDLFDESIRLYLALSPLIDEPPNMSCAQRASYEYAETAMMAVSQLERNYALWADCVPLELSLDSYSDLSQASGQAIVLSLRSLTLRLLLHRPVIVAAIRRQIEQQSRASSPMRQTKQTNRRALESKSILMSTGTSLSAVVATAVQIVATLHETRDDQNLNAKWYQLAYCLNAFMSLIATISLDLSKWSSFLTTPVGTIIPTLFKAKEVVVRIACLNDNYFPAQRALWIINKLLDAMHLSDPSAETAVQNKAKTPEINENATLLAESNIFQHTTPRTEGGIQSHHLQLDLDDFWELLNNEAQLQVTSLDGFNGRSPVDDTIPPPSMQSYQPWYGASL